MKFEKKVTIGAGFRRSINLEKDLFNVTVLEHYICSPSAEHVLLSMCDHIRANGHSAFTWTGPYGSGKSSLAVFLSVLASNHKKLYDKAVQKLSLDANIIKGIFPRNSHKEIIAITGTPDDPIQVLSRVLDTDPTSEDILSALECKSQENAGIILCIDEMGKFLEKSVNDNSIDVYVFQQIAELANRSAGNFIFVGILHQSLIEYSRNLPKARRDEWMKVQGRFVDLSVNAAGEEQIDLISRAIICDSKPKRMPTAKTVVNLVARHKPVNVDTFLKSLTACWPLHPVVTLLLGALSRKRFAQNQRSLFSFLSSVEPFGFQFFLKQYDFKKVTFYTPALYWNYIRANFENAILASSDAKIWTIATEAINKCAVSDVNDNIVKVMQTIAVIDIFKGDSGLVASKDVLETIFESSALKSSLEKLEHLSLIRLNKHSNSYSLFEGSDFNIDEELDEAYRYISDIDFKHINKIASFKPVLAKRHYHTTGAMRWMDVHLVQFDDIEDDDKDFFTYAFGEFLIIVPADIGEYDDALEKVKNYTNPKKNFPQIMSVADNYEGLLELSKELLALEWIKQNASSLIGDQIARSEVENRMSLVSNMLVNFLDGALNNAKWYKDRKCLGPMTNVNMTSLASDLADEVFHKSPLFKTELLNRNKPSGSANGALKLLLNRMISHKGEERLGIEGFPAEGGIFKILLEDTGIYQKTLNNQWLFESPKNDTYKIKYLWQKTDDILLKAEENVRLNDIYAEWVKPPFGIKKGLQTFLITSYLLAKKGHVAVYLNGTYVPEVDDLFIDYLIKNTVDIHLRFVSGEKSKQRIFKQISHLLKSSKKLNVSLPDKPSPLEVARVLVQITEKVNPWVLRTRNLSKKTIKLREILKSAHDPNKLIFDDIPKLFIIDGEEERGMGQFSKALDEIIDAYPRLLKQLRKMILFELQVEGTSKNSLKRLRTRAENIHQASGDFRIDALAARLSTFENFDEDVAGIAGLAANKPIREWIDLDLDRACIEIAVLCQGFKKAELYARVKGREKNRHAVSLISALSGREQIHHVSFDVLGDKKPEISSMKKRISALLPKDAAPELVLAVLTELSVEYMTEMCNSKDTNPSSNHVDLNENMNKAYESKDRKVM